MNNKLRIFEVVTNLIVIEGDRLILTEEKSLSFLPRGQVGTIVESYQEDSPQYLVEFADQEGREYAMAILKSEEILALHYELSLAS